MKLLNITTTYMLLLIMGALSLWSIYFYWSIQKEFYENIDEFLMNRKFEIVHEAEANPAFLNQPVWKTDFKIQKTKLSVSNKIKDQYSDVMVYEPLEKENEPYRKFDSGFILSGVNYKLEITASLLDTEEVILTIRNNVILLYLILIFLLFIFNKVLLQRLWKPFYTTLDNLSKYRLDKDPDLHYDKTYVHEFNKLNLTVSQLIQKNHEVFQNQKQFIENASHELQTPLARAGGKIEHLIQKPNLDEATAEAIQSISEDLEKLSGLNKSLLLLSKIENDQFHEKQEVNIGRIIEIMAEEYADFMAFKNIRWSFSQENTLIKNVNSYLAQILLRNLVKNAIYHNIPGGFIEIIIQGNKLIILNTGKEFEGNTVYLFKRFSKNSDNQESLGLGLAIVQAISNLYGFGIIYTIDTNIHQVIVSF